MTCSTQSLLQASERIGAIADDEAVCRAGVSRAYYASYHCCRKYYATLPYLGRLSGNGVHEQLINSLCHPSDKLTTNARARSAAIGKYLRVACSARVHADYTLDKPLAREGMQEVLLTAQMIFKACTTE